MNTKTGASGSSTEQVSARYRNLDSWPTDELVTAMYEGQLAAASSVGPILGQIADAAEDAAAMLARAGRLVYVGAGTSGRIAVQDGAELPPTFNWPFDRLVFLMAGGPSALLKSSEGAEDRAEDGARAIHDAEIGAGDVVIGIAASGTTPYTIGALRAAAAAGAVTIAIANNPGSPLLDAARHSLLANTGGEVIAGSTRMKAGTAQKIVLNLLSTAIMVRLGRVYDGLMVQLRASNAKLSRRAKKIVVEIVGCSESEAERHLAEAGGDVKTAIVIGLGVPLADASALLERHQGNVRFAIAEVRRRK
jgi:N-acetylmuramic acid 6-phosphate etherase